MGRTAVPRAILAVVMTAAIAGAQTNTLIVVADDLGVDAISTYREGAAPAPTPTLDGLAAAGVLFRNAYANPLCAPTRAAMMTGRHGHRTGVGDVPGTLPLGETTLPEVLDRGGVAHALIGKWHLGGGNSGPNDAGWSHFSGSINGMTGNTSYAQWTKVVNGSRAQSTVYPTTDQVDDAIAWIGAQTGPWVVSLNFLAPHEPFHAPPAHLHSYDLTGQNPATNPTPFYKAAVEAIDTELGRLFAALGPTVLARTNVLFIGDNGTPRQVTEAPFQRMRAKGTVYEGGINVPLIVSGPAVRSPGRETAALVHAVDVFATVAELSGLDARQIVPASVALDGVSFVPLLADPQRVAVRDLAYAERFSAQLDEQAARDDRYKLVRRASGDALHDLVNDPFERVDLLGRPLTPDERTHRDRLASRLDAARGRASWFAFGAGCGGTLAASGASRPVAGGSFAVRITGLPAGATSVVGVLGLSRSDFNGAPLPLPLDPLGMPGCVLYVRPDAQMPLPLTGGEALWTLPVPSVNAAIGMRFYQQALVFAPSANAAGAVVTNAGEGVIHSQ